MTGNEENSYKQEECRQGSGETAICRNTADGMGENIPFQEQYRQESGEKTVVSANRRGKHFLGTVQMGGKACYRRSRENKVEKQPSVGTVQT